MGIVNNLYQGYKNLITGKNIKSEAKRKSICRRCEFRKPGPMEGQWCMKCPCWMPAKVKSPGASCKINKW